MAGAAARKAGGKKAGTTGVANVSLRDIPKILHKLPLHEQEKLLAELEKLEKLKTKQLAQDKFLAFVKEVWPTFIAGRHHAKMADAFERVARGELKRLIINMPPRHTKSEFASYLLPAWFLGKFPHKKVIQCSHTAELAVGFGRKVRNLVDTEVYHELFPDLALSADSKAAGRWNTSKQGDYFAIGIGGAVTGKGADVLIIDDPHSEQEAALAEINPDIYDKTYEWYTSGPRQRLQPGGAIVIVMCMTGDTDVLMADGTHKQLCDITVGDYVASYEAGKIRAARVTNFQSSGVDNVFTVKTQSGKVLRANEEHPFLVEYNGERKWAKLKHLCVGMSLVGATDVNDPLGRKQNPDCATLAKPKNITTAKTRARHINPWATTVSGRVKPALAERLFIAWASACRATENNTHPRRQLLSSAGHGASSLAMASPQQITSGWWPNVEIVATYAENPLPLATRARIGMGSCASTIATILGRCADSCATIATSLWATVKTQIRSVKLRNTYKFAADPITEITPDGREEVFDIEVERTENFIANGIVSHNTRWSKRDLTGQILKDAAANDSLDEWEVIEFPAILPSGHPLWPQFWSLDELEKVKRDVPNSKWMAQYQQNPVSEAAAIVKREWWREWPHEDPPHCDFVLMTWDTAFEKTSRADFSACTTWGVFYQPDDNGIDQANIILLNAFRDRMEFPTLKRVAIDEYKEWQPDSVIIEKKASGAPLIYEMRAMGIPVQEFTPTRGNDKISRLNSVADIFASGRVWAPATRWAEEVIDEVAEFPAGANDDYTDTVSMAMHRFRRGGYISTNLDEPDEIQYFKSNRNRGYY
jgi:predicted phage terminase large subunit-like protein